MDIIQPDLSHAGGITEVHKIAAMAEAYDVALAPHCPLGPIALAACLQIDAVCANAFIQEQSLGLHYNQGNDLLDYLVDPERLCVCERHDQDSSGPGLGIQIDEAAVQRAAAERGHDWRNSLWRRAELAASPNGDLRSGAERCMVISPHHIDRFD